MIITITIIIIIFNHIDISKVIIINGKSIIIVTNMTRTERSEMYQRCFLTNYFLPLEAAPAPVPCTLSLSSSLSPSLSSFSLWYSPINPLKILIILNIIITNWNIVVTVIKGERKKEDYWSITSFSYALEWGSGYCECKQCTPGLQVHPPSKAVKPPLPYRHSDLGPWDLLQESVLHKQQTSDTPSHAPCIKSSNNPHKALLSPSWIKPNMHQQTPQHQTYHGL